MAIRSDKRMKSNLKWTHYAIAGEFSRLISNMPNISTILYADRRDRLKSLWHTSVATCAGPSAYRIIALCVANLS